MKKTNLRILPLSVTRQALAVVVGLVLAVAGLASVPAQAQDVARELQNLKRDLATLQRYVYNGKSGPVPTLSEDTASSAGAGLPSDAAAQIQIKLQEMERQLRVSTGKLEETEFKLRQLDQRLDTALADIDYRLTKLEGGNPNAPQQTGSLSGNAAASSNQPQQIIPVPGQSSTTVISSEGSQGPGSTSGNATAGKPGTCLHRDPTQQRPVSRKPPPVPGRLRAAIFPPSARRIPRRCQRNRKPCMITAWV